MLLLPLPQRQPPSNASKPTLQPLQLQLPLQRVSLKIQKSALAQDHLEQQRLQSQKGDVSRFFFQHIVWSSVQHFCAGSDSKRSAAANVAPNPSVPLSHQPTPTAPQQQQQPATDKTTNLKSKVAEEKSATGPSNPALYTNAMGEGMGKEEKCARCGLTILDAHKTSTPKGPICGKCSLLTSV
jgi:ribosomal protein S27AE